MLCIEPVEAKTPAAIEAEQPLAEAPAPLPCPASNDCSAPPYSPAPAAASAEATAAYAGQQDGEPRELLACDACESPSVPAKTESVSQVQIAETTTRAAMQAPGLRSKTTPREPLSELESWEFDEDLLHMQRLLRRFDEPATRSEVASAPPALPRDARFQAGMSRFVAGLAFVAGMTALACGVALLGWSWRGTRPDLFMPGLLSAVGGQCGLLLGLALRPSPPGHAAQPPSALPAEPLPLLTSLGGDAGCYARIDRVR
jgi:hypothetical protein